MDKKVCFIGHRKIHITLMLKDNLYNLLENMINKENVKVFLFGSKSEFNTLCYEIVSKLKQKYPFIKRIYYRVNYEKISSSYKKYLLENYEDVIYPIGCKNSGKLSYIKRNQEMIDNSNYCVFYYNKSYVPLQKHLSEKHIIMHQSKSGTFTAYQYARRKKIKIINVYNDNIN